MTDSTGDHQQGANSMATKLFKKIRAKALGSVLQFKAQERSDGAPSLAQLLNSLKPTSSLSLLSEEVAEEDVTCDEDKQQPKLERKRPKLMPAAKDWMSHQLMRDTARNIVRCRPEFSQWFTSCVAAPRLENKRFHTKFRHRFRMRHSSFLILLGWVRESGAFEKWTKPNRRGPVPTSPVELLLLGSLRCLGRGWTFDDLEEQTSISQEVHRDFFHAFITWGANNLFERSVSAPTLLEDPTDSFKEFEVAGMAGCVGSMDACHVGMLNCPHALKLHHGGWKLQMPARTFNLTANHRRRILSTTTGHPGRWNDKTLVRFDKGWEWDCAAKQHLCLASLQ